MGIEEFCGRRPLHWKCRGADPRCILGISTCLRTTSEDSTHVVVPTMHAKSNDDVFRADTNIVTATKKPGISTTAYIPVNPGAAIANDHGVLHIGPAKISVNGWIVLVACLGVALIVTAIVWKITKRWCDTCETRAMRPPDTIARITGENESDERRRRRQRKRMRKRDGAHRARYDSNMVTNVPVESLNRMMRLQQNQLPGIETNRHLPQIAGMQTFTQASVLPQAVPQAAPRITTVLAPPQTQPTAITGIRYGEPEHIARQRELIMHRNQRQETPPPHIHETLQQAPAPQTRITAPAYAHNPAPVVHQVQHRAAAPAPPQPSQLPAMATPPALAPHAIGHTNPMFSPDVAAVRGHATAPPPTYSLYEEQNAILAGPGESARFDPQQVINSALSPRNSEPQTTTTEMADENRNPSPLEVSRRASSYSSSSRSDGESLPPSS